MLSISKVQIASMFRFSYCFLQQYKQCIPSRIVHLILYCLVKRWSVALGYFYQCLFKELIHHVVLIKVPAFVAGCYNRHKAHFVYQHLLSSVKQDPPCSQYIFWHHPFLLQYLLNQFIAWLIFLGNATKMETFAKYK